METLKSISIKQSFLAYLPPTLWAAGIFFLSAQGMLPSFEFSTLDFIFKKSSHMFVYGVLYFLLWRAVQITIPGPQRAIHWILPLSLTLLYAMSDELHQNTVPGRSATFRDIGYDILGTGIVFLLQYRYI